MNWTKGIGMTGLLLESVIKTQGKIFGGFKEYDLSYFDNLAGRVVG